MAAPSYSGSKAGSSTVTPESCNYPGGKRTSWPAQIPSRNIQRRIQNNTAPITNSPPRVSSNFIFFFFLLFFLTIFSKVRDTRFEVRGFKFRKLRTAYRAPFFHPFIFFPRPLDPSKPWNLQFTSIQVQKDRPSANRCEKLCEVIQQAITWLG